MVGEFYKAKVRFEHVLIDKWLRTMNLTIESAVKGLLQLDCNAQDKMKLMYAKSRMKGRLPSGVFLHHLVETFAIAFQIVLGMVE